jgi:predicted Abi (CAAX) family protease
MNAFAGKMRRAVRTIPDAAAWRRTALEAAWAIPALLLLGFAGGLLRLGPIEDPARLLRLAPVALVLPAFGEELLFRAAMLPPPGRPAPGWRLALPVALFVAWHPLQAPLFGPRWAAVVLDPWFLAATALLGIALTRIYRATGSIWPCVALHWVVVVGWKVLGGPSPWSPG